jgi:hypothetical protein
MRKAILPTVCVAAAALALLATTSHASAASNTCWAGRTDGFCKTTCIAANRTNHFVHIDVAPFAQAYHVRDCTNGIIVYSGSSGFWGVNKTITGLYASYTVYLYGALWPTGYVTINNN